MGRSNRFFWAAGLLLLAIIVLFTLTRLRPTDVRPGNQPTHVPSATEATIAGSGEILGVGIGSSLEEARERLKPYRDRMTDEVTEKKGPGRRKTYWKLDHPEYAWINVKPDTDGRIMQISVHMRPEKPKPLVEIGDLSRAASHQEGVAVWDLERPGGLRYRLVASGPPGHAISLTMNVIPSERP